jgi:hypothetical protein
MACEKAASDASDLKKKLGLKVRSVKREGKRVYSIKP